jgi:hypothetical protein
MQRWFLLSSGLLAGAILASCGSVSSSRDGGGGGTMGGGGVGGGTGVCAFAATYTVIDSMGLAGADTATLTPPNSFHLERNTVVSVDAGGGSCDPPLPACNDPARIDVRDVEAAIAHPDVQAALAMATPPIYGNTGVADGPSLGFRRADGRGFTTQIGCDTPSPTCRPIPPGINALAELLRMLLRQERMDPECSLLGG